MMIQEATRRCKKREHASRRKMFRQTDEGKMMVDVTGMVRAMLRVERERCCWVGTDWQIALTPGTADDAVTRCEMVLAVEAIGGRGRPPTVPEAMAKMIEDYAVVSGWAAASSSLKKHPDPYRTQLEDR